VGEPIRPTRQVAGGTPLDLALLLERSGVRLVAPTQALALGLELLEFVASFPGPRPASAASCRERACRVDLLRLRLDGAAATGWLRGRLERARLPGWRVEHVVWDMSGETDDRWRWTLSGVADSGAAVWLRIELQVRASGGRLSVSGRRCWLLGPPELACGRIWRALVRRLGRGPGLMGRGEALEIDVARASLGPAFAAAGWRLPNSAGLRVGLAVTGEGLLLSLGAAETSWPEGQVDVGDRGPAEAPEDPLARLRGWLRGGPTERAMADAALLELATAQPAVAGALLRARALALRFVDRERCVARLHEWLRAAPADGEAWWLLAVQHAILGESAGLVAALRGSTNEGTGVGGRLALALVLQQHEGGAAEALALLEALVAELPACAAELQAAVWRALARSRAGERATPAMAVLAAVSAALGEEGWRRREEAGELRAQVAAALVASGRPEAETAPLLRRLLGDVRPGRWDRSGARVALVGAARRGAGEARASARIVSEWLAQEGRWSELVAVLERQLVRLGGAPRIQALRRIARIHRHHLNDPASAEQALRVALEQPAGDEATDLALREASAELVTCLEMQGRVPEATLQGEALAAPCADAPGLGDREEAVLGDREEAVLGDREEAGLGDREEAGLGDREEAVLGDREEAGLGDREEAVLGDREEAVLGDREEAGLGDREDAVLGDRDEAVLKDREEAVLGDREDAPGSGVLATLIPALARALEGTVRGGSPAQLGVLLAMIEPLLEVREPAADARAWLQLGAFMAPKGAIAGAIAGWPSMPLEIRAQEPEMTGDSRGALRAALRAMAGETAGIRAPGVGLTGPQSLEEADAVALAEVDLGPMRAALGLELPVRADGGAAEVGVRNERPPAIGVGAAFLGLSAAERRFRLAFAAAMIADGLAIVTDPQGASLPELLAALHHLADRACPLRLPGAQAIVRALAARGFTGEQLPPGSREALALEIAGWQQSRASVARLAQLLRRDCLQVALRLSGALDGALRTIGREARLSGPPDSQGTLQALASPDGQCLLRAAGLLA
jgi:hypothetical protein